MQTPRSSLLVFELGGAHGEAWPRLAQEVGLGLQRMTSVAAFRETAGAAGIVATDGDAARLHAVFREIESAPIEIAAVAAAADHRSALMLCRAGASEIFVLERDRALLRDWLARQAAGTHVERAPEPGDAFRAIRAIRGESDVFRAVLEQATRIAPQSYATVLVVGESGTGKLMLARAIHDASPRAAAPFIEVYCAAVPDHRLERELFGQEPGALADRAGEPGFVDAARGGTLVLRSIEHATARVQAKLVRLLADRTIRREGGSSDIRVDVRVIATTEADLARSVRRGEFRRDLWSRLSIVVIAIPPLRARAEDIVSVARHHLAAIASRHGVHGARFTPGAERMIQARPWPGNIRELHDAIERAVLFAQSSEIGANALRSSTNDYSVSEDARLEQLDTVIRRTVIETVDVCGGNKSDAARRLGISRTRLQRLLRADPRNRSSEHLAERADD